MPSIKSLHPARCLCPCRGRDRAWRVDCSRWRGGRRTDKRSPWTLQPQQELPVAAPDPSTGLSRPATEPPRSAPTVPAPWRLLLLSARLGSSRLFPRRFSLAGPPLIGARAGADWPARVPLARRGPSHRAPLSAVRDRRVPLIPPRPGPAPQPPPGPQSRPVGLPPPPGLGVPWPSVGRQPGVRRPPSAAPGVGNVAKGAGGP